MDRINNLMKEINRINKLNLNFNNIENNFNDDLNIYENLDLLIFHFNNYYTKIFKTNDDIIQIQLLSYKIAKYLEKQKNYESAYEYYLVGIQYYYPKSYLSLAIYFQYMNYNRMTLKLLNMFNFLVDQIKESKNYYNDLLQLKKNSIDLIKQIENNNMKIYSEILINL